MAGSIRPASERSTGSSTYTDAACRWFCGTHWRALIILFGTIGLTGYLFMPRAEGLLSAAGHRTRIQGQIIADQNSSFQSVDQTLLQTVRTIGADPAVSTVAGFTGGGGITNNARMFVSLKPLDQRSIVRRPSLRGSVQNWRSCPALRSIFSPFRMCASAGEPALPNISSRCRATIFRIW